MALPKTLDPSRPTNSVEAGGAWAGVSRGLAYEMCRTGTWPCQRAGSRLLIITQPFLAMFPAAESLGLNAGETDLEAGSLAAGARIVAAGRLPDHE